MSLDSLFGKIRADIARITTNPNAGHGKQWEHLDTKRQPSGKGVPPHHDPEIAVHSFRVSPAEKWNGVDYSQQHDPDSTYANYKHTTAKQQESDSTATYAIAGIAILGLLVFSQSFL